MTSMRFLLRTVIVGLAIAAVSTAAIGAVEKTTDERDRLFQERTYLGKPFTYWLQIIRDRNKAAIALAFDAVRSLGPDGWIAVPDLTRLEATCGFRPRTPLATIIEDVLADLRARLEV